MEELTKEHQSCITGGTGTQNVKGTSDLPDDKMCAVCRWIKRNPYNEPGECDCEPIVRG